MDQQRPQTPISEGPALRILDAADDLFYRRGYGATGINQIIEVAAVAKASFYHHFPSKLDLVVAYLEQRHDRWMAGWKRNLEGHRDSVNRVLSVFDYLAEWLQANDYRGCAFLNTIPEFSDPDSKPRQLVRSHKRVLREQLAQLCAQAGRPDVQDEVFLLVEGAMIQAAVVTDLWPVNAARRVVESRFRDR